VTERTPLVVRVVRSPWPRLALLVALVATGLAFSLSRGTAVLGEARDAVAGLGVVGVVAFVAVYAVATAALFPVSLLSAAAGLLFGPVVGVAAVWCGAMLGATASFAGGRVLGRSAVQQLLGGRIDRLDRFLGRRGLAAVLIVRLVPLFPFTLVNYGSAVTALRFSDYAIGTGVGIVPGVVVYVALGGTVGDPTSPAFLIAVAAFVVLAVGGGLVARRMSRREQIATTEEAAP
jgi:uncharacterized membrane protein YdjX (TVP38/TMEM64 family)